VDVFPNWALGTSRRTHRADEVMTGEKDPRLGERRVSAVREALVAAGVIPARIHGDVASPCFAAAGPATLDTSWASATTPPERGGFARRATIAMGQPTASGGTT
jgi:outer membrane protein OmpA-like peptidoglycan-associated protein